MEPREERRLTAVLSADVVAYSRLMGRDEVGTLAAFKAIYKGLIVPKAAQYHGRIVKLMGDGALMEFASVVDSVRFAVEIQCAMRARNQVLPHNTRLQYRIGINIGDIIVEDGDIYGDGVNISARLQALADPGGICLARNVYNQIKGKLDLTVESLGKQEVKNIAEPITVYRVLLDDKAMAMVTPVIAVRSKVAQVGRRHVATALILIGLILSGLLWWRPWPSGLEVPSVDHMALPLPEKPSLAVLPFKNLSSDAVHNYFADGITEDLITDLSHLSGIFVIARNSSWAYKDQSAKVQQVAEDLGVRYVLEGSVRRDGERMRINAQLIDAMTGRHLWAERYDGSTGEVLALQDKVVGQIVTALAISLTNEETARVTEAETSVPQAYDTFLQGWDHYRRETRGDTAKAIDLFKRAIALDAEYTRAYAGLAAAYWRLVTLHWQAAVGIEWLRSYEGLNENLAKSMENPTPLAYSISAEWLARQGRPDAALAQIDRALALGPSEADSHVSRARILNAIGRADTAEQAVRTAMRLNPHYGPDYLRVLGQSLLHQERYGEAAQFMERAVNRQPDLDQNYVTLAIIYGHLGRTRDASLAVQKYQEILADYPPLTVQAVAYWWYGQIFAYDEAYRERLMEGLRKAGVPEGAGSDIKYADLKRLIDDSAGEYLIEGTTKIDVTQAKALHARNVVFVDVREGVEFKSGHIPSSVNLEMTTGLSKERLLRLVGKDDEVVFSCFGKYCPYSAYACAKAVLWGFTRVYYFAGGFPAWRDAGYPIDASKP